MAEHAWVVFVGPGRCCCSSRSWVEFFLLRDRPGQAGHERLRHRRRLELGRRATSPMSAIELFKKLFTHPIMLTVAFIELCTGVLRNGVMHWFPFYVKEVWVLPKSHTW
jgi:OPA family glycerol-3-phosphate transporter-like MFS transporter